MNFSARSAPTQPAIELRSLRRSLNTPVLAIAELPVGPGSAVIAVHADPSDGLPRYTLAVRSERSRKVVFFSVPEEDRCLSDPSVAAEAALSLAEGMGFLFEEDAAPLSSETAALIWEAFVESADPGAFAPPVRATPLLTKFRRSAAWVEAGSALDAAPEVVAQPAEFGFDSGFEVSDSQIAQPGDR